MIVEHQIEVTEKYIEQSKAGGGKNPVELAIEEIFPEIGNARTYVEMEPALLIYQNERDERSWSYLKCEAIDALNIYLREKRMHPFTFTLALDLCALAPQKKGESDAKPGKAKEGTD